MLHIWHAKLVFDSKDVHWSYIGCESVFRTWLWHENQRTDPFGCHVRVHHSMFDEMFHKGGKKVLLVFKVFLHPNLDSLCIKGELNFEQWKSCR